MQNLSIRYSMRINKCYNKTCPYRNCAETFVQKQFSLLREIRSEISNYHQLKNPYIENIFFEEFESTK